LQLGKGEADVRRYSRSAFVLLFLPEQNYQFLSSNEVIIVPLQNHWKPDFIRCISNRSLHTPLSDAKI